MIKVIISMLNSSGYDDMKLQRMCSLAGINDDFPNHSLRATVATQMFEMGLPEKLVQEQTGHKSVMLFIFTND